MRGGGCFHPESLVKLYGGSSIPIAKIEQGMVIQSHNGWDIVEACVHTKVTSGFGFVFSAVNPNLYITEWHPIIHNGKWVFPRNVAPSYPRFCNEVVNLVLKNRDHIVIGGVTCSTLAHGVKGDVIQHEFYGSEAFVRHLHENGTWERNGVVSIAAA